VIKKKYTPVRSRPLPKHLPLDRIMAHGKINKSKITYSPGLVHYNNPTTTTTSRTLYGHCDQINPTDGILGIINTLCHGWPENSNMFDGNNDFSLMDVYGNYLNAPDADSWYGQKVLILDFSTSWCGPCQKTLSAQYNVDTYNGTCYCSDEVPGNDNPICPLGSSYPPGVEWGYCKESVFNMFKDHPDFMWVSVMMDLNQPHSCTEWGEIGEDGILPIIDGGGFGGGYSGGMDYYSSFFSTTTSYYVPRHAIFDKWGQHIITHEVLGYGPDGEELFETDSKFLDNDLELIESLLNDVNYCPETYLGCTDIEACNYDPNATGVGGENCDYAGDIIPSSTEYITIYDLPPEGYNTGDPMPHLNICYKCNYGSSGNIMDAGTLYDTLQGLSNPELCCRTQYGYNASLGAQTEIVGWPGGETTTCSQESQTGAINYVGYECFVPDTYVGVQCSDGTYACSQQQCPTPRPKKLTKKEMY